MEHIEFAKITSKGQVTIPSLVREILHLEEGSTVMFKITEKGVLVVPCEITEKPAYTESEWEKIERFVAEKGRVYKTARAAKRHLKSL